MNGTISHMRKHLTVLAMAGKGTGTRGKDMNNEIVPLFDEQKIEGLSIRLQKVAGQEGCLALSLDGQIDMFNIISFQRKIGLAIEAGFVGLIFDLSRVHYISSMGIGSFTSFLRTVRPRNGDVVLVSPQPPTPHPKKILLPLKLKILPRLNGNLK